MKKLNHIELHTDDTGYEYISRKNNRKAVIIIPILFDGYHEDKYQLIVHLRPSFGNKKILEFPAGLIDDGESSVEAAIRELEEETQWRYNHDRFNDIIGIRTIQENCPTSSGLTNELIDLIRVDLKNFHKVSKEESLKSSDRDKIEILNLMTIQDIKNFIVINKDILISSRVAMLLLKE